MTGTKKGDRRTDENEDARTEDARAREVSEGAQASRNGETVDIDVADLRAELDRVNAKWLRALADLDNYRKRVGRERACWCDDAKAETILPLLDVLDDFERAMACDAPGEPACDSAFREGVELIFRRLRDALEAQGLTAIPTEGRAFDPTFHEAVAQVESSDHASNEIVEEVRRGYTLGERLLRPSRVVVAA